MEEKTDIIDSFKKTLNSYKAAYLQYKKQPIKENENNFFVKKQSLNNLYDYIIKTNYDKGSYNDIDNSIDINNQTQFLLENKNNDDNDSNSNEIKKHRLDQLKEELNDIKKQVYLELSAKDKRRYEEEMENYTGI